MTRVGEEGGGVEEDPSETFGYREGDVARESEEDDA